MTEVRLGVRGERVTDVASRVGAVVVLLAVVAGLALAFVVGERNRCHAFLDQRDPRAATHCPPTDLQETRR